jgi:hypothetical protein
MVSLLSQYSKSDKQLELWKKGVGNKIDSVEDGLNASASAILLKYRKISGG